MNLAKLMSCQLSDLEEALLNLFQMNFYILKIISLQYQIFPKKSQDLFVHSFQAVFRSSPSAMFLGKCVLNICSKCTGQHPCRSAVSIKLLCTNCTPAWVFSCNLLHIFRTLFPKNISGWLLLTYR